MERDDVSTTRDVQIVGSAVYRLYFKGLMSDEISAAEDGGRKTAIGGYGVAICDQKDKLLFDLKEPVNDAVINRKEVEVRALIRGLTESLDMGIRNVVIYCEDCEIYQNITGRCNHEEKGVIQVLAEEVGRLRKEFTSSEASLVDRNDIKFAYELAREAIVSQTGSADGDKHGDDDDDDDDDDGHDHEDDNPWAYGCGCDHWCSESPPAAPVFDDIDSYHDYYYEQQRY